jgi:hypothetical protein
VAELEAQAARTTLLMQALQEARADAAAAKADAEQLQRQLVESDRAAQQQHHRIAQLESQQQQQQHGSQHKQQQDDGQDQQQQQQLAALRERASTAEAELQSAKGKLAELQQELAAAEQRAAYAAAEAQRFRAAAAAARSAAPTAAATAAAAGSSDDEALQEQVELLMRKVIALKKSRDKLLAQMDRQSVEMEQSALDSQVRTAANLLGPGPVPFVNVSAPGSFSLCKHAGAGVSPQRELQLDRPMVLYTIHR